MATSRCISVLLECAGRASQHYRPAPGFSLVFCLIPLVIRDILSTWRGTNADIWEQPMSRFPAFLLAALVVCAAGTARAGEPKGVRLVYEIDQQWLKNRERQPLDAKMMEELVAGLKRRIDTDDRYVITIRPAEEKDRIVIVLPASSGGKALTG